MMLMLQSLLEERFQLQVHRELREMPGYAQVPARGGLKLPPPRDGSCECRGEHTPGPGDPTPAPRCGGMDVLREAEVAHPGRQSVDGRVRAQGLRGARAYGDRSDGILRDINLEFRRDDTTDFDTRAGLAPPPPVEVLVIDHVEKPSAN